MAQKFRKKPVVIEAVQWTGRNISEIQDFMLMSDQQRQRMNVDDTIHIHTLEGLMTADTNDWIIKGIQGEFYPCKPDIFDKSYELVTE